MSRSFTGAALLAAWLALAGTGFAQYQPSIPTPYGAARTLDGPPPPAPEVPPNLQPGPITPEVAPQGPPDSLSLPPGHTSAFQCETFPPECAFYSSVGIQFLQRQTLGAGAIAVVDTNPAKEGFASPYSGIVAQRFKDAVPDMGTGVRTTVGYLFDNQALEVTGFYVFPTTVPVTTTLPGQLNLFFYNAPNGFQGDNGLFLHADRVETHQTDAIGNLELNFRRWNAGLSGIELILGVRYVYFHDKLTIFTGDDDISVPLPNGQPNPALQAYYQTQTTNNIFAPQFGGEYTTNVPCCSHLFIGGVAKAAFGVDLANITTTLTRGDGLSGFDVHDNHVHFSQIYEIGGFLEYHALDRFRVRAGYNAIWLVDVATSVDQINYNLAFPQNGRNLTGSVLYHGPMVELQFLF